MSHHAVHHPDRRALIRARTRYPEHLLVMPLTPFEIMMVVCPWVWWWSVARLRSFSWCRACRSCRRVVRLGPRCTCSLRPDVFFSARWHVRCRRGLLMTSCCPAASQHHLASMPDRRLLCRWRRPPFRRAQAISFRGQVSHRSPQSRLVRSPFALKLARLAKRSADGLTGPRKCGCVLGAAFDCCETGPDPGLVVGLRHQQFVTQPYPRWGQEIWPSGDREPLLPMRVLMPPRPAAAPACLMIVHGMNEYIGRYGEIAAHFAKRFIVAGFDLYAHGLSNPTLLAADRAIAAGETSFDVGNAYLAQTGLRNLGPMRRDLDQALRHLIEICDRNAKPDLPISSLQPVLISHRSSKTSTPDPRTEYGIVWARHSR